MPDYVSIYDNKVTYAPIRSGWRAGLQFRAGSGVTLTATENPNVGLILEIAASGGGGIGGTLGATDNVVPRSDGTGGSTLQASAMVIDDSGNVSGVTWHGNTLTEAYGGTNQTSYTKGDILYASAANTLAKLAGNTSVVRMFLRQTGTGIASDAPAWDTVTASDVAAIPSSYMDTDGTLAANSDVKVATQKATKTYADTKIGGSTGSTDNALLRADGTGGFTAQAGAPPTLSDAGALAGLTGVTSTGAVDLSGASSLLVPASAGAAPTAAESVAYDSTRKVLVHGDGSATHVVYSGILPFFGAGQDGAIDFDGSSTVTVRGASFVPSGSVYTLTRMISATSVRVRSGVTVQVSQYVILCTGTLTFDDSTAKITDNGNAAAGKTAGGGRSSGNITMTATSAGAAGRSTAGAGSNGSGMSQTQGGSGGDGGAVTGFGGGSGGVASLPPANTSYVTDLFGPMGYRWAAGNPGGAQGGAGGASGASLLNSNSGGGGGGGGFVFVAAAKIVGAGVFEAKGGAGADATIGTGLGAGGGGGGGGGQVLVVTIGQGYTFTTSVAGGTKGVGVGTSGTDGVAGSPGVATIVSL